ncbi:hypothetical protein SELMODRAFT_446322 [Selaginella moellendorffii]|uniref:Uncharacterized protein n=1 Tax=Selaginella moellendorffii TaxID=88036 RepID=D8SQG6_SELML|nr:hypothetical protein SELMODRAFT_446322 [Selaginella moellendorffii]
MGAFSCDSSPGKKISGAGHSDQIAPEKEGVSIFFGRSSIETVKNLAVKRWNSIPKEFQEDVSRAASPGSVARKAAFFDHYIRTVSLEKKAVSGDQEPIPQLEEHEEHAEQEEGEEQEEEKEEKKEEEEEKEGAVEYTNDPEERMDQVEGHEEQEPLASALATQVDVQCPMESAIYSEQQTTMNSKEEVDEESTNSTVFSAKTLQAADLSLANKKTILKGGTGVKSDATAPASVLAAASQSRKTKSARASATEQQVINKWNSKQGLVPGVRAPQVTSKTTTEQLTGKKSVASSRVASTKNESAVYPFELVSFPAQTCLCACNKLWNLTLSTGRRHRRTRRKAPDRMAVLLVPRTDSPSRATSVPRREKSLTGEWKRNKVPRRLKRARSKQRHRKRRKQKSKSFGGA